MDKKTIILSSARAIRHKQSLLQENSLFLPNYITMGDFISKLTIVEGFSSLDEDTRILLLLEASNFKEFSQLQIQRNFFTFTKNSSYIFKFFEELSVECYEIQNLDSADIYAEYEEHITILQELYKRYEQIIYEKKLLDKIFLPKLYKFNSSYAKNLQKVEIYIDGYLTNFELKLLDQCCKYVNVNCIFKTSQFNKKMQQKFIDIFNCEFEDDKIYTLSLNNKKIITIENIEINNNITCEPLSESLLQIGFLKEKIYKFIEKGYAAQNIVVVLPDEKIATLLQVFDNKSNLNFAMGSLFSETTIYKTLQATAILLDQSSQENHARVNRIGNIIYMQLLEIYHKQSFEVDFIKILEGFIEFIENKEQRKIYEQELYNFKNIISYMDTMKIKSLFALFLQRLQRRTIDDVRGGKITVMGVLETRGISFDGVIIIDFNDSNVPKKSDKDMFLNTSLRKQASLPTMSDRENLQKHYYYMLLHSAKEVAITYVDSSDSNGSRFLKHLHIIPKVKYIEDEYAQIIFKKSSKIKNKDKEIIEKYSFKDINLSSTRLKTYLTCKRKYYLKYIKHLQNHEIPKDMPKEYEIGNIIHKALKELYTKKGYYTNEELLFNDLSIELDKSRGDSELDKYLINLQKNILKNFCKNEIKRFHDGWQVVSCEENFTREFAGITIVGQIDRVDKHQNGSIEVLDYKTGNYILYNKNNVIDATDFQLEFYYLLASTLGDVDRCSFYDLKETTIVEELFLEQKLELLKSIIKDLIKIKEINFKKCEEDKNCHFCEFNIICQREI